MPNTWPDHSTVLLPYAEQDWGPSTKPPADGATVASYWTVLEKLRVIIEQDLDRWSALESELQLSLDAADPHTHADGIQAALTETRREIWCTRHQQKIVAKESTAYRLHPPHPRDVVARWRATLHELRVTQLLRSLEKAVARFIEEWERLAWATSAEELPSHQPATRLEEFCAGPADTLATLRGAVAHELDALPGHYNEALRRREQRVPIGEGAALLEELRQTGVREDLRAEARGRRRPRHLTAILLEGSEFPSRARGAKSGKDMSRRALHDLLSTRLGPEDPARLQAKPAAGPAKPTGGGRR